ncbi:MAG: FtsX-like permease family protein [Actinomycetota bacterium]
MGPIVVVFVVIFGLILFLALRQRLLGRLAARSIRRRIGQSLLVVAGLMVGTTAITASLIGADSTEDSTVLNTYRSWNMVDDLVTAPNNGFFSADVATRLAADPTLGRVTDAVASGIDQVASVADLDRRQGESGTVTLVGLDPAAQRKTLGAFILTDGKRTFLDDVGENGVVISRRLANALNARVGDRLRVTVETLAPGEPIPLIVHGIARADGPGAYTLSHAVFAPLATAQRILNTDKINVVRVSAVGGVKPARSAFPQLRQAVAALGTSGVEAHDAKVNDVEQAKKNTEFIKTFLVALSVLIMAAGAALVVNLISMLAEERRAQLGILRALGLTRRRLVLLSVIEGAVYSLAAAAVGVLAGIPVGRVISSRFAHAFSEFGGGDFDFRFTFSLKGSTVAVAFALGAILTLGVVFFTARRTSKMSIPAAIRNLPEPAKETGRHLWRRILVIAAAVLGLLGVATAKDFGRLASGIALIAAVAALSRRALPQRLHTTLTGFALGAWSLWSVYSVNPNSDSDTFFPIFVVSLLTSVLGLTIMAVANLRIAEWFFGLLGRAFSGLRAMLRPPLAYMARRGLRTGLTTGVFAIVLSMLQMFAVFAFIFRPDYAEAAKGYDVRVLATGSRTIALPADVRPDVEKFTTVSTAGYVGEFKSPDSFGGGDRAFVPIYELTPELATDPVLKLDDKIKGLTEEQAWQAALGNTAALGKLGPKGLDCPADPVTGKKPGKGVAAVRASAFVINNFGSTGQCIRMQAADGPVTYRIAGIQTFNILDGMFVSNAVLSQFKGLPRGASGLIAVRPGVSPHALAQKIEGELFEQGADVTTTKALLDQSYRANRAFFSVIDLLMRMGLIVGVLALGIVALRAIIERRHVIGVLRAIGYKRWQVMSGLMTEAATTTFVGVVVGMAVGLMMGYIFYRQSDSKVPFGVDWPSILGAIGAVFVAVVIVTLGPAWRASRLPPAEAVRYTE